MEGEVMEGNLKGKVYKKPSRMREAKMISFYSCLNFKCEALIYQVLT